MSKATLIRIKNVVGILYLPDTKPKDIAVVKLGGAPGSEDWRISPNAPVCNKMGIAYLGPDYIGVFRSGGVFNFKSSVQTIYECLNFLSGKVVATEIRSGKSVKVKFRKIILIGSSFGGAIAPFVDKYKHTGIKDIVLINAVTDWKTQNGPDSAEPINEFNRVMKIGMKYVWRGYQNSQWPKIIRGKVPECNPIDNTKLLQGKNVYIFHANKDKTIQWQDSFRYYGKICNEGLVAKAYWHKLKNFGHSGNATPKGIEFALVQILKNKT